jgi:hypothetical protein
MSFKFFQKESNELTISNNTLFLINPVQFANAEFCFQFGDEEPVVFATGNNECHIHLRPASNANMTFTDNGREFKLFARERVNPNMS